MAKEIRVRRGRGGVKGGVGTILMLAGLALSLIGCAHADTVQAPLPAGSAAPAIQSESGFPDLRSVPRAHLSNTNQAYWDAAAAEVLAASEAMNANPRGQYQAPTENPTTFLEEAQRALADTRDSH